MAIDPGTTVAVNLEPTPLGGVRRRVHLSGIVQGVGLRPCVCALATRLCLAGWVGNDGRGVVIEVEGPEPGVDEFLAQLPRSAPRLALIERIQARAIPATGEVGFAIAGSRRSGARRALVSPDSATCDDCLGELFDPADRRFLYPFTNCANCGPRFTIVCDVPYDRPFTTMAGFAMCAECAREYHDSNDRRFHAQPISCPHCGPRLQVIDRRGTSIQGDPIRTAAELLQAGRVVAIKGLGGYHLAAHASSAAAVTDLRARKHREDRPFAVMVRDLDDARALAEVGSIEAEVLSGPRRPIVLLQRRAGAALAEAVAPGTRWVGVMLPYTPLHHLLCRTLAAPMVLTSGNVSDEPIAYRDEDAFGRLGGIADAFLRHDRPIHTRTDDSVSRVLRGRERTIRRSRGWAPQPIRLPDHVRRPILACGAHLKNTFCLAKGRYAFVSHHVGDLENVQTLDAFRAGIAHFQRLFGVAPQVVAHDLHPEYLSTRFALELEGLERVGVQHHHAHLAACLAENGSHGPAIGVAFDGLGYGTDGTLWGGEFLIADLTGFERVAHFEPVPMPGGSAAIRQPWRMAAAYLDALGAGARIDDLAVAQRNRARWRPIVQLARARFNAPLTSSVGRLFDAVAAILGLRDEVTYEGQAAVLLEQCADAAERGAYRVSVERSQACRIAGTELIRAVIDDVRAGTAPAIVAGRFHNGLARTVVDTCRAVRDARGVSLVALSGGVFQNALLFERTVSGLEASGFRVVTHARVPANDGGISFGQAVVAAARQRRVAADRGAVSGATLRGSTDA